MEGDSSTALSGVGHRLLAALDRHLSVVGCVDYQPRRVAKLALAGATFKTPRERWRARFHTSLVAHRALSATLTRRLRACDCDYDLALQVHGWVAGQPRPYALYLDQTRLMAERGWPAWLPLGARERARVLSLERRMYAGAAHVLVMGEPVRSSLIDDYGVAPERITVIGGGLMFDVVPPPRRAISEPVVTFVGREFDRKGGPCLLAAFALVREEIPHATLRLVGVPRRFSEPGVVSLGRVRSRDSLSKVYAESRVFCLPSRYEPYGLALAEAMAHSVPCVGTTVQSIPEILDHGRAGLLVAPDDPGSLATAILRILLEDQLADRLASAGRRHVEQSMQWDHVAARAAPALIAAAPSG